MLPVRLLSVLAVASVIAVLSSPIIADVERASAHGHASAVFRGKVTVDGSPASAGVLVSIESEFGSVIATGLTGDADLPADKYSITVPDSDAPHEDSVVTVTVDDFADVESVDVRYVYFGATATADIAAFTTPRTPLPDPGVGQAFIETPQFVNISPQATGTDGNGNPVRVIGGTVRMDGVGETVAVPVVLFGSTLESLDDPVSGITIRRVDGDILIRIPFKDQNGDETIRVLVDAAHLSGKGFSADGEIIGLRIDAPTRSRDFTEFDERVGVGSVKVLGNINAFPGDSLLEMNIVRDPSSDYIERLTSALADRDEEAASTAFTVEFQKTGLDPTLEDITLRLTVGKAWFDDQAGNSVVVVRLADDGTVQFFPYVPQDPGADPLRFDLESPDGLSAFIIIAVKEASDTTPTSTPTAIPVITATVLASPPTGTEVPRTPTQKPAQPTSTSQSATTVVLTERASTPVSTQQPGPTQTSEIEEGGGSCSANSDGTISAGHIALIVSPLALIAIRRRR